MGLTTAALIYLLVWWVVLFAVLPFGVTRDTAPGRGHDPGAPQTPHMGRKIAAVSLLSLLIVGGIEILVRLDVIRWYDWFDPKALS